MGVTRVVLDIILLICLLSLWWLAISPVGGFDFCNNGLGDKLCSPEKHFVCDGQHDNPAKSFKYIYPNIRDWVNRILDWHNKFRNEVSSGTLTNGENETFFEASRMRVVLWDHELAYLSYVHVSRCNASKTACYKSKKYSSVGQNIAVFKADMNTTALKALEQAMNIWYKEKDLFRPQEMHLLPKKEHEYEPLEHFAMLINDEVSKIGCSMAFCSECDGSSHCYFLTCHYSANALMRYRLYKDGPKASHCDYWDSVPSKKYPNLCENTGVDFPEIRCNDRPVVECTRSGINVDTWTAGPKPRKKFEYCSNGIGNKICLKVDHVKHFVCDPTQVLQKGFYVRRFEDPRFKKRLIDLHNEYRNKIAGGTENNGRGETYPSAGRMRTILWDEELEELALVHVKRCNLEHSKCRSIPRFKYMGENMANSKSNKVQDPMKQLENFVYEWYIEKDNLTGVEIFHVAKNYRAFWVRHFVAIVNDELEKIGCAYVLCRDASPDNPKLTHGYFLTCMYDFNPPEDDRYYFVGPATSDCNYWRLKPDTKYTNLCKHNGIPLPKAICPFVGDDTVRTCFREPVKYRIKVDEWDYSKHFNPNELA